MKSLSWLACIVMFAVAALAQPRPYIGYVYPAGVQQGTTVQIRLGGQSMDDVTAATVTGTGVTAQIVEYCWRVNNQEQQLLREQLQLLRRVAGLTASRNRFSKKGLRPVEPRDPAELNGVAPELAQLIVKIQQRTDDFVQQPACASIANIMLVDVTVAADAPPGPREIRLVTARGVSNPMPFQVGQVPEFSRKPMRSAMIQTLGKEVLALRKRPPEEAQDLIKLPATLNGQIASGEVNSYRFAAHKGQRLVFSTQARQLIPFIADAVPGWFQPVLVLSDANGKEVAYNDDFRFKPDPTIFYEVPKDGDYVLAIYDSLYRGREDFIYRITAGELPYVTTIFPLGGRVGDGAAIKMKGWNLDKAELIQPAMNSGAGMQQVVAKRDGFVSNRMPFALGTLPEILEKEPNNDLKHAQKVTLPVMVNGRIDRAGDWDVFEISGKAGETIVAEVLARRLDSPLDSVLKLTDATGKVLAFNDDYDDIGAGANTHYADSYLMAKLPADGIYFVHVGDTARNGGEEFAYRLRISEPQPDFELRVAPSSISLRRMGTANVSVYVIRKDGFNGAIKLGLKDAPEGVFSAPVTLSATAVVVGMTVRTNLAPSTEPFSLVIEGKATVGKTELVRAAVPAEDKMQAFLWRHLLPAETLQALIFNPLYQSPLKKVPPEPPAVSSTVQPVVATSAVAAATPASPSKPKFTQQQVAARLRELKRLYGAGFLTDEFYLDKVAECQVGQ